MNRKSDAGQDQGETGAAHWRAKVWGAPSCSVAKLIVAILSTVVYSSKACIFALLMLTSGVLSAQEYNFRTFGVTEGLNNLAVRQVYQDRTGDRKSTRLNSSHRCIS